MERPLTGTVVVLGVHLIGWGAWTFATAFKGQQSAEISDTSTYSTAPWIGASKSAVWRDEFRTTHDLASVRKTIF